MGPLKRREVAAMFFSAAILALVLGGVMAHRPPLLFNSGGRNLLQENSSKSLSVLSERTRRIDPLNDFKTYKDGYNLTNKHYWSSTIFTGKYGYGIAALWLVVGVILLLLSAICLCKKRGTEKRFRSTKTDFWLSSLVFVFVVLAIIASGVILGGSSRFHSAAKSTKNIIQRTAEEAYGTINNITEAVTEMQNKTAIFGNIQGISSLNSTTQNLDGEADTLQRKALRNMHRLSKGINILEVVTIVTITINLSILLLLIASKALRLRWLLRLLIILCWLLTMLFWIYFGLYYFLYKFSGDTCIAFSEYQLDPHNSSLGEILPCSDRLAYNSVLQHIGAGIHDIIGQVNAEISTLKSSSLQGVEFVCNPFSGPPGYNYQPENCSSNTIQVGDVPKLLKVYTCMDEGNGGCQQGQFISPGNYSRIAAIGGAIHAILNAYPNLRDLVSCQVVKDAFSDILLNQCEPLKKYAHMSWAGLAALATIMAVLVPIQIVADYLDRRRSSDGSVRPQPTSTDESEDEVAVLAASVQTEVELEGGLEPMTKMGSRKQDKIR